MISFTVNETELRFEHSLVFLSEWEAEFEKPFYSTSEKETKTIPEMIRYFECMLVSSRKKIHLVSLLSEDQMVSLTNYIHKGSTATTVRKIQSNTKSSRENVTSELIYYWLVAFKIPFQPTDTWHLNRLLMLVEVCSVKNAPAKKQTRSERANHIQEMRRQNEERRAQLGTRG